MRLQEDAKKESIPVTKDEYKPYENVLPSPRTIVEYKQFLSAQHEKDDALALYNIPEDVKVTLQYYSTPIKDRWRLAMSYSDYSNKQRFSLRPLFFVYEDHDNIISFVIKTYKWLAIAIQTPEKTIDPKDLWERTTSYDWFSNKKIENRSRCTGGSWIRVHSLPSSL